MALLGLCRYAITCVSPQNRLKGDTLGGHYGRGKGGYNGNGGYNGPKVGDNMVRGHNGRGGYNGSQHTSHILERHS